jgi:membrane-bound lytic murein transglycosylase D
MNPQYRHDIIPGSPEKPHILCLPANYSMTYIDFQDSIPNFQAQVLLNEDKLTVKPTEPDFKVYKVRRGDTLSAIAKRNRVTVTKLKRWNSMHSSRIYPGQRLKIY